MSQSCWPRRLNWIIKMLMSLMMSRHMIEAQLRMVSLKWILRAKLVDILPEEQDRDVSTVRTVEQLLSGLELGPDRSIPRLKFEKSRVQNRFKLPSLPSFKNCPNRSFSRSTLITNVKQGSVPYIYCLRFNHYLAYFATITE